MNDSANYAEYVVAQKSEGTYKLKRIGMIVFYVVFTGGVFGALCAAKIFPVIALLPVLVWFVIWQTWRFVSIEHEYVISSGTMTFTDIYGNRTRKKLFEKKIKDMERIAPMTDEYASEYADAEVRYDWRGSSGSPDSYFLTCRNDNGKKVVVFFEATNKAVKIMRFYNSAATVDSGTLRF